MTLFPSEKEMQKWLSSALNSADGLADIIVNLDAFEEKNSSNSAESRILQSFKACISSLYITEKISEDENISISHGETLKPDFVLYAPETQSIIIVELKNIAGPSRQAGTELAAYSCEIRAIVPFLSDGDIVHVLISTEWPTLLKHFARHEIFWQGKNFLCLQPVKKEHEEIGLRILELSELAEDVASFKVGAEYLGGYHICLYHHELYSNKPSREQLNQYIEQFKSALYSMATTGNRFNSHGFAFLWKNHELYTITVLNFAPFQSLERFLHIGDDELPDMVKRFIRLVQENDPIGHGNALSTITESCINLLTPVCSPYSEDFTHWKALRKTMMNERSEHIAFVGWGRFGEVHLQKLKDSYKERNTPYSSTSPELGFSVISEVVDDSYQFIDLASIDIKNNGSEN